MPQILAEYGYVILYFGGAILQVGAVGFLCGLLLPNLKWYTWTLIGAALGLASIILLGMTLDHTPYPHIEDEVTAAYVARIIAMIGHLVPEAITICLAFYFNNRRDRQGAACNPTTPATTPPTDSP